MKNKFLNALVFIYLIFNFSSCVGAVKRSILDPNSFLGFFLSLDPFKLNPPPKSKITLLNTISSIQEGESTTMGILLQNNPYKQITVTCSTDYPSLLINGARSTTFVFDSSNFSTQQSLNLTTVTDNDNTSDNVTLSCSATGLDTVTASITVSDNAGIILSGTVPTLLEGDTVTIGVSLSRAPTTNVTVNVSLNNSAVTINSATTLSLTFTPSNYNTSQSITILSLIDGNSTNDPTTLTFQMTGIADVTYNLTIIDDNVIQLTGPPTSITEGTSTLMGIRYFKSLLTNNSITITSSNPAAITVNGGASATFNYTPGNATTDQNVTLAAVLDANLVSETVSLTLTTTGMDPLVIVVTTVDIDVQNMVITGAIPTLTENMNGSILVHLTNLPPTNVTVNITTSNASSLTVSPSTLTFTPGNYNIDQAVTVNAIDDANETAEYLTVIFTSTSAPMQIYNITTIDDDTRILLSGASSVNEGGSSVVTVSLSGDPGIPRTINLTSSNLLALTLGTASLSFSSGNYSQSISINGVQDANIVSEAVTISATSAGLISGSTSINTVDDDTMNILLTAGSNLVSEGSTSTLNLRLTQEPSPSLTVTLNSSIAGSVSLSPASFTFDNVCPGPQCWSTNQVVTLTGVEDVNQTSETSVITASAPAVTNVTQNITTIENDTTPVFTGATTVSETGTSVITVSLSGDPGATRTVSLVSSNLLAMTVSPSTLTFNSANWNIPQTILVAGVPDNNIISESVTITGSGVGLITSTTTVNTVDTTTMAITLSGNPTSIDEGGTGTFNVKLTAEPSPSLTVTLASGTVGSVSLATTTLTFDNVCPGAQCWSSNQTVTMNGVEDVNETSETVSITATAPSATSASFNIDTADNDSKPVFTGATSVNENGTALVSVTLSGNPGATRTVNLVSSNVLAVSLLPATLTFNSSNWNVPQSVLVSGVPDGNSISETVTITGSGVSVGTTTTTVSTVDTTTMAITLSGNPTSIDEGGTGTFNVKLTAEPSPSLTVTLASGTVGSVSLATTTLTFDNVCPGAQCWSSNQTVTMNGVEDVNETSETVSITATAPSATSASFNIDTADNDSKPVFTGATSVNENGTAVLSVALSGNPGASRTVNLVSGNTLAITLSPASLVFNSSNWNVPQTVVLTGVSDANTASESVTITGSGVSVGTTTTTVNTVDTTTMAITLSGNPTSIDEGGTGTFNVKLTAEPSPSLTVTLASGTVGSVSLATTTLTFDNVCPGAQCWSSNQTVTMNGVEDVNETSETVSITATAPSATSASFNIDTADNDSKPVFTGATSVNENGTAVLSVALSGNPGASRTVNLVSGNTLAITLSPASLVFNSSNWNVPQTVVLTGVSDANTASESVTITGSGVSVGTTTTTVNTVDTTTMAITLSGNPTSIDEGGTGTFNVKLTAEPSPSLTVTLASGTVGSVSLATTTLTFDNVCPGAQCWSSNQTVTMNGVEDVNETSETVSITATAPSATSASFNIDTADNDSKPVFTGATSVNENGTALVSVTLSGNPGATRTVNLVSSNVLAVSLLPATLIFNSSNWNVPQSVLVSGVPDGNSISETVTITGSGVSVGTATANVNTVDTTTMAITLSGNPTSIDEGGTGTFNVKLTAEPSPSLTVTLASGTVGSVSLATTTLTFDNVCPGAQCWSSNQTVTMNGVEDVNETSETVSITATAPSATSASFNIDTADNDSKPVFTGATSVNENGTAVLSVALSGNPGSSRTVNLVSGNTLAITLSPASLVFNSSNWNVPQTVVLTGVSDANTASESVTITGSGVSVGTTTTTITTVDTTVVAILMTPSGTTVQEGLTGSVNVSLSTAPAAVTTVTITTSNAASLSLSTTTLTFDSVCPGAQCWSTPQTVTLTGVEDANQTSENVTITATAPSLTSASASFDTIENDTTPVFTGSTNVTEGSSALIAVALSGNPGTTRTVNVTSGNTLAITLSPATLTFTAANWNIPQAVLLTGVIDSNSIAESVTITGSGVGLVTATTTINTVDTTTMAITLSGNPTSIDEGGTGTFNVKLTAEPSPSLTVTLASGTVGSVSLATTTLTFDNVCPGAQCWSSNQTVTMNGVEDVNETSETVSITATAPSATSASFNIDTADNDSKPVFTGATSVNENGTAVLSVALSGNPGASRTVNLVSGNTLAITLSPASLVFNSSNWNVPQTVVLTGVADANTVSEAVTITGSGVSVGTATVNVNTVDTNTMNIALTPASTTVGEGSSTTFTVNLTQEPSPSLVVSFASSNTTSVTVAPVSITFDNVCPGAQCWSTLRTITLNGVVDANQTSESVTITASAPAVPNASFTIATTENDAQPVFSGVTTVTEGGTALLSVSLSGNPGAARTLNLTSSNPAAITLSPATLNFTAANWNIPQAVLLTGISDSNASTESVTITGSGVDLGTASVTISTVDANTMSIVLSAPSTIVDEGSSASFNVKLSQEPSPSLVVSFASSNVASATVAPASVTFDNVCPGANCWSNFKTITVTGVEDINETTETVTITASAPAVTNATINFDTTDNDSKAVFSGGATITEGSTSVLTVALSGNPGTARTMNLTSSNLTAVTIAPTSLNFNAANWNVPQTVILTALADTNTASETVTITGNGTDLGTSTTSISTVDTSLMNIILSAASTTVSEGSTATMNVKLSSEPSPSLTVTLSSSNAGAISVSPLTLTFDNVCPGAQCWSANQSVTLTGVEDANQTSETVTISASAPSATSASLDFKTIENDTGIVLGGATSVTEGGIAFVTVVLTGDPGIDRIISLASSDTSALLVFPPSLTFTSSNWNTPQIIQVTGVSDVNTIGETVTITASGTGVTSGTGTVTTVDTNVFDLVVTNQSGTTTVNEGSSLTFAVNLNYSPPTSPYVVTISAPQTSPAVPGYVATPTYVIDPANSGIGSTTLTFTTANYATPQTVTINAPENYYIDNKTTTLSFSGAGVTTKNYSITVVDNDPVEQMLVDDGMGPSCNDVSTSYDGVKMLVAAQCSNGGTFNRVKAFRCESNFSYCLDTNTPTLDNGGDNNARSLTALYFTGQAMIVSENKSNGRMNFFTGPLGSWTYYDMSDVAKFNLGNNTAISPRAAWDSTNNKVIVAGSYGSGIYLYSFDKFGNSLNTPVNIAASNVDPGIMIETITDTVNSKVTVTFQYQPTPGQYALSFVQCNLDLTGCSAPATISSLVGLMADGLPLWIKHSQMIYDSTTNKIYIITSMGNTEGGVDTIPKLVICNPDMTGCTAQTINTGNRSGLKTKIAVDNYNNKLLILAYDATQSYSVVLNRCSLTGTGCTRRNLTNIFGMNIGSSIANPFIDTANKKLRFVAINNASGGVLTMYSMLLFID